MQSLFLTFLFVSLFLSPKWSNSAELEGNVRVKADWLASDRAAWMDASKSKTAEELKIWYKVNAENNSFIKAAHANIDTSKATEYTTIQQRQAFYDVVTYMLEFDPSTPESLRPIKFFHATATVTSRGILGYVETDLSKADLSSLTKVDRETRDLVSKINSDLFGVNMRVIHDLFYSWNEPRSPKEKNPSQKLDPLRFDLEMVDVEQSNVERTLLSPLIAGGVIEKINAALANVMLINPGMRDWNSWIAESGITKADFRDLKWRTALGRAIVFQFHGLSKADYLNYIKNGTLPSPAVPPTKEAGTAAAAGAAAAESDKRAKEAAEQEKQMRETRIAAALQRARAQAEQQRADREKERKRQADEAEKQRVYRESVAKNQADAEMKRAQERKAEETRAEERAEADRQDLKRRTEEAARRRAEEDRATKARADAERQRAEEQRRQAEQQRAQDEVRKRDDERQRRVDEQIRQREAQQRAEQARQQAERDRTSGASVGSKPRPRTLP
jgi:hypothetical protein